MYCSMKDLTKRFACSRTSIYRWMKDAYNPFPSSISIGGKVCWIEQEVLDWESGGPGINKASALAITSSEIRSTKNTRSNNEVAEVLSKFQKDSVLLKEYLELIVGREEAILELDLEKLRVKAEYNKSLRKIIKAAS